MGERSAHRVLSVIHGRVFGGAHNQLVLLQPGLRAAGFEVIAAVPPEAEEAARRIEAGGVEVLRTPLASFRATANPREQLRALTGLRAQVAGLRRAIGGHGAELVQAHGVINPHAGIAARREGVALVWQLLDTRAPGPLRRLAMPYVVRRADAITSWGRAVAAAHPGAEALGERLVVVYPPVDPGLAPDPGARRAARQELGAADDAPVIATLGVRNSQKGHEYFVRAAAEVTRERPDAHFRVIGAPSPGHAAHMAAVEREAESLGLRAQGRLGFLDPGARPTRLLHGVDLFLLTSVPNSEGMPTAILEAMALGIPVVATDVGAVRELVEDGVTGFVVPPGAPERIAEAALRLLVDPELRARLGDAGRDRSTVQFPLDRLAALHADAYRRALSHRASP